MSRCARMAVPSRIVVALAGIFLVAVPAGHAQSRIRFAEVFENLTWRPGEFAEPLCAAKLAQNVGEAADALPSRLPDASLRPVGRKAGDLLRIGVKQVPVADATLWKHFEGDPRLWIDILQFADLPAAERIFSQRSQTHSGRTNPNYFIFFGYGANDAGDVVGAIFRHDRYLFNIGFAVPFSIRDARGGDPEKLRSLNQIVGRFVGITEAVMRQVVAPEALAGVPEGPVTEQERRARRLASFAKLWGEVKYNFVFLSQRPEVDWDGLLEPYMARIATATSQDDYLRILAEALALLRDGHTGLTFGGFVDKPAIRIAPIGGRPVVTVVGNTPELGASGLVPGMELVAIEGKPVDDVLRRDVYPVVSASTPQGRDVVAFDSILQGEPGTSVRATFADLQGNTKTLGLTRDLAKHPDAFASEPLVEFRELPGGLVYVALNSFDSDKLPGRFDQYFGRILESQGLIIDVRKNQGGSSVNGFAVIARLIAEPTALTSAERTRLYKPTERARGNAEEWYEYPRDRIEPRGDKSYLGPVVVLTGAGTFSAAEDFLVPLKAMKRATLIGSATAGSTGQPLSVALYGTNARICSKWDRFPDGTEFVGVGIQPDVRVEPTKADIAAGRDAVLVRAVEFLIRGAKR